MLVGSTVIVGYGNYLAAGSIDRECTFERRFGRGILAQLHFKNDMFPVRIGLFGIGLDTYWPQFPGLKPRLEGYLAEAAGEAGAAGRGDRESGLIDSPPKAFEAGHRFRREDVDLIFLHVTTYALSSTVLPVVQRAKVPVIILNLSPEAAIDYASLQSHGGSRRHDRRMAGVLLGLPGAGDRQCFQPRADSVRPDHGAIARRSGLLE